MSTVNSFGSKATLTSGGKEYIIYRLDALKGVNLDRLPFSLRILLENLLRCEDNLTVTAKGHRSARPLGRQGRAGQ